jgi:DNA-binding GntR family transcriptional regulator
VAVDPMIERAGPRPLHAQIAARFRQSIADGSWPLHHQLPSEIELAAQLDVSRGTVRRALQTLTEAGLIVTVQGKGTFVVAQSGVEQPVVQEVFSLAEGLQRQGIDFMTEVRSADVITADENFQHVLEPPAGGQLLRLVRRRAIQGTWVAYLVDYIRTDICPGIGQIDFEQRLVFDVIERDYGLLLEWGTRTYGAEAANETVSAELEIPVGSPILYQEQLTYLSDSRAVEYSQVWIRADRLKLSILLRHERARSALPAAATP